MLTSRKIRKTNSSSKEYVDNLESPVAHDDATHYRAPTLKSKEEIDRMLKKSWDLAIKQSNLSPKHILFSKISTTRDKKISKEILQY
jgi:hypothetical protein